MDFLTKKRKKLLAYKRVFETDNGRLVLNDLIKSTGFLTSTFDADPHVAAFQEGQRALVSRILTTINIDESQLRIIFEEDDEELLQ